MSSNCTRRAATSGGDISARVFNSTDVTVPQLKPGEWTSLNFDSERWDTANLHETATNSRRLKAPVAGKYYIFGNITWESPIGSGLWGLRLQLNGKTVIAEQTLPNTAAPFRISMSVGTLYALAAGDYVEVQEFQNSGNPLLIRISRQRHQNSAWPSFRETIKQKEGRVTGFGFRYSDFRFSLFGISCFGFRIFLRAKIAK